MSQKPEKCSRSHTHDFNSSSVKSKICLPFTAITEALVTSEIPGFFNTCIQLHILNLRAPVSSGLCLLILENFTSSSKFWSKFGSAEKLGISGWPEIPLGHPKFGDGRSHSKRYPIGQWFTNVFPNILASEQRASVLTGYTSINIYILYIYTTHRIYSLYLYNL